LKRSGRQRPRGPEDLELEGYITIESRLIARDLKEIGEEHAEAHHLEYRGPGLPTLGLWVRSKLEAWRAREERVTGMERREAVVRHALNSMIRRIGPRAWERFGDVFAFDLAILFGQLPASTRIINGTAPCVGVVCTRCCKEILGKRVARKAAAEGIWTDCACGGPLARIYEADIDRSDVIRALFPWSGQRGEPS